MERDVNINELLTHNVGQNFQTMPNSEQSERAILGGIIINNELLNQALDIIKVEDFYLPKHQKVYAAMVHLMTTGRPIDPITIGEIIERDGSLVMVGGYEGISELTSGLPRVDTLETYAKIVKGKSMLRELIKTNLKSIQEAYAEQDEPDIIVDKAEAGIFAISQTNRREGFVQVSSVISDVLEKAQDNIGIGMTGLTTGFIDLDRILSGMQKSDLIIVAARPAMGKTAMALSIAQNAAIKADAVVAVFSMEMSKEALVQRMLCSEAHIESGRFRAGNLNKDEWRRLAEAFDRLSQAKIFIDQTPMLTPMQVRAKSRRLAAEQGRLDLIIIDYLQLMSGSPNMLRKQDNRQQEITGITRELKGIAIELNVPLVCLSQLSRAPESRSDHRPQLSDLRESGAIEQDADIVGFLYREEYYNKTDDNDGLAEFIIAKHRNGAVDTVKLGFLKQFTRFENLWLASY